MQEREVIDLRDVSWPTIRKWNETRVQSEARIAAALRFKLDTLGETKWLEECQREMNWGRAMAYRHLNPEQMEKARRRAAAKSRLHNVDIGAKSNSRVGRTLLKQFADLTDDWDQAVEGLFDTPPTRAVVEKAQEIVKSGFAVLAHRAHPDKGGTTAQLDLLRAARDWLVEYVVREGMEKERIDTTQEGGKNG